MKCQGCGAPLGIEDRECAYCGKVTPYGERLLEERRIRKQEKARQWKLKCERRKQERELEEERRRNMPAMPCVPLPVCAVMYVITLGLWSSYWYITRSFPLNRMKSEDKLPLWLALVYPLLCFGIFFLLLGHENVGINASEAKALFAADTMLCYGVSAWLAWQARKILRSYLAEAAPSDWTLALFGPLYLQYTVNKIIHVKEE